MIVYFENGSITNEALYSSSGEEMIKVDAGMGYNHCRRRLRQIDEKYPFDTEVYTNSLDAFSNCWCWDEDKKIPMIYVRNENGDWMLIDELTTRELRRAHNLEKFYVNGEFGFVES